LPDTPCDQAVRTLDRLRSIVSEVDWTTLSGMMNVTMSAGVSEVSREDSAEDILARADAALYRAKDAGRNQVIAA
jgi:diguanylate cyclase